METSMTTYIFGGLIFLILLFIILTLAIRKREDNLTDEFGKESAHAEEAFFKNEKKTQAKREESILKEKSRTEKYKKENNANETKNSRRFSFNKKDSENPKSDNNNTKFQKTSFVIKIVLALGFVSFLGEIIDFIIKMTDNYDFYYISNFFYQIDLFLFLIIGFYGLSRKRKEGFFLWVLFFVGREVETKIGVQIIYILKWFLIGAIFKENFTVRFAVFLEILITAVKAVIFLIQINTTTLSLVGSFKINPSFILMINIIGLLQSAIFLAGIAGEYKKSLK